MAYGGPPGGAPFPYRGKREREYDSSGPDVKRPRRDPPGCTIWLGNLPWDATDRDVAEIFGRAGEITSIRVKYDRETGKGKGFAYVTYAEPRFAQAAVAFNGVAMMGRPVRVELTGDDGGPPPAKELGRHDPIPVNNALPSASGSSSMSTSASVPSYLGTYAAAPAPAPAAPAAPAATANPLVLQLLLQAQANHAAGIPQNGAFLQSLLFAAAQQTQQQQLAAAAAVAQPSNILGSLGATSLGGSMSGYSSSTSAADSNTMYANGAPPGRGPLSHTIFIGNLSDEVTEDDVIRALSPVGEIIAVKWITDKHTGRFKGCGFVEFFDHNSTQRAKNAAGTLILGRPLRIDQADDEQGGLVSVGGIDVRRRSLRDRSYDRGYDDRRQDDRGGRYGDRYDDRRGGSRYDDRDRFDRGDRRSSRSDDRDFRGPRRDDANKPQSQHVPGSKTVFVGSLADEVTDETIKELFKDCGTITHIRWVNDHRTGKFKGCGFLEFETEEACLAAGKKNGTSFLGRTIRVDFSSDKPVDDHRSYDERRRDSRDERKSTEQDSNVGSEPAPSGSSLTSFLGQLTEPSGTVVEEQPQQQQQQQMSSLPSGITPELLAGIIANTQRQQEQQEQQPQVQLDIQQQQQQPQANQFGGY